MSEVSPSVPANSQDENSLLDRLLAKASDLATLEIITVAGTAELDPTTQRFEPKSPVDAALLTRIQLIEGDILSVYPQETLSGDLQVLKDIHQQREAQGLQIINERIAAVKELIKLVSDLRSARQKRDQTPT